MRARRIIRSRASAAVSIVLLIAASCGDAGTAAGSGDVDVFCDQARSLDSLQRPPNDEELDRLTDSAPDEIKKESEILAASARDFRAGNEEAAGTEEIQDAADRFDEFVASNCRDEG